MFWKPWILYPAHATFKLRGGKPKKHKPKKLLTRWYDTGSIGLDSSWQS